MNSSLRAFSVLFSMYWVPRDVRLACGLGSVLEVLPVFPVAAPPQNWLKIIELTISHFLQKLHRKSQYYIEWLEYVLFFKMTYSIFTVICKSIARCAFANEVMPLDFALTLLGI